MTERCVPRGLLLGSLVLMACAEGTSRVQPHVEDVAGVEIAVLPPLPDLLDARYLWTFRPVRAIQTVRENGEPIVFDPRGILELSDGRLLVHDPSADQVFAIFDSTGSSVLQRFGRSGQGPDEIGSWISFRESRGRIAVLDPRNRQLHEFSPAGDAQESAPVRLSGGGGKSQPAPGPDGFLAELIQTDDQAWHRELVRTVKDGPPASLARLPEPSPQAEPGRIQQGRVIWSVVGEHIVAMWSARPRITVYDAHGTVVRQIDLPLTRREITERDIADQVAFHGGIARSLRPGPAALTNEVYTLGDSIFGLYTAELWKANEDPDLEIGRVWWRLFSVRGEYVGVVALPVEFWPLGPTARGVWGRVLNERGEPVIQELELVPADGAGVPD